MPLLAIIVVGALLLAILWLLPKAQAKRAATSLSSTERPMAENEFRKTLGQLIGGLVIISGLFFTYDQALTAKSQFEKQIRQSQEQFRRTLNRASLSQALEQIDESHSPTVRLGAIFTLRQLLDAEPDDAALVASILSSFIRQNSQVATRREESASALAALATRPTSQISEDPQPDEIDLDLRRVTLSDIVLRGSTNLSYIDFEDAFLYNIRTGSAYLVDSDLSGAIIQGGNLTDVSLRYADLSDTCFVAVSVGKADFEHATLTDVKFCEVDLSSAINLTAEQMASTCLDENSRSKLPARTCTTECEACRRKRPVG